MTALKIYLEKSGAKQTDLAEAVGVSRGYMSQLASGLKAPSRAIANAIERCTQGAVTAASWDEKKAS